MNRLLTSFFLASVFLVLLFTADDFNERIRVSPMVLYTSPINFSTGVKLDKVMIADAVIEDRLCCRDGYMISRTNTTLKL